MKTFTLVTAFALCMSAVALPQVPRPPAIPMGPAMPAGMQDPQAMMNAYMAAQAAANKPGDERLSCDAMLKETRAIILDQQVQAQARAAAAAAAAQKTLPKPAATDAMAIQQAAMQQAMQSAQLSLASMPKMARVQRLVELGVTKNCAWTTAPLLGLPELAQGKSVAP